MTISFQNLISAIDTASRGASQKDAQLAMTHQMVIINQFFSLCAERLSIGQNITFITKFALLNIKTQKVHALCQRVLSKISPLLQKRQKINKKYE